MKIKFLWMLMAVVAVGCSVDKEPATPKQGKGRANFTLSASNQITNVVTRTTSGYQLPAEVVPAKADFTLKVTGEYFDRDESGLEVITSFSWGDDGTKCLDDWDDENPNLEAGEYSVENSVYQNAYQALVASGDPNAEGEGKAYFTGSSPEFNVRADATADVSITAKLANSCFTLAVTEWMLNYYADIKLTITTEAGAKFSFEPTTTEDSALIFVKPNQKLKISGEATKSQNGVDVEFPLTAIGNTLAAETHYKILVNHSTAGAGGITINFGNSFTEVDAVEAELNGDI